ncbi:CLUMA_CG016298, isoform A [Clunio marinus]|uniref:CLUMA_CG016298, isoform A n=1 Tax=Clunio marinus TaxID=568069 RepID=A0A1J1IY23_9DIPT|nr:CLUMA_CG016298, isoform A [Clunio marinus]
MSSLAMFANLDVDKLITDIAARPAIWDKNFNGRQNKGFLEDTWEELAAIHNAPKKIIKAKWKGLRDNFRIQWKMIPRDENDQLLVSPEEFTGTKWQYYRPLLFLADNMGKSRNSYNSHYDDSNYELLHQFEPAIEIPSDDEIGEDTKPELSPKLHQRLMAAVKTQRDPSPPSNPQNLSKSNARPPPKLRAIPQLNLMDVHSILARSAVGQTTISPAPAHMNPQFQNPSSSTPFNGKRRKTDEVTTTGCGASSNDEYPSASSPSGNLPNSSNDDDYHFLMSLQPYLTQFTGPQKLRIRMRIQKLIFKELYQDDIDD